MKKITSAAQQGYSTVQVAIGVLVGIIVLLGAIGGYSYVSGAKINNELQEITKLKDSVLKYSQTTPTFTTSNVTGPILASMNFFPVGRYNATTNNVSNQWGGTIVPAAGTIAVAGDSINFTFNNVPVGECQELTGKFETIADVIAIASTAIKDASHTFSQSAVLTACNNVAASASTFSYTVGFQK
jgi:PilS N terminal